VVNVVPYSKRA